MAVNEIYGAPSSWYTISRTFNTLKIANFTSNAASLNNARIAYAMQAGSIQAGTLLDSSVCTHSIPTTLSGHEWNTMFDVGGINVKGGPDNCIIAKHFGNSPGIMYRVNSRSSGSAATSLAQYINSEQSFNSPIANVFDNWDVYRFCPVTQIDFKRFVFAIVLQVCRDFETAPDSEGIKRRTDSTSVPESIMIDLQTWLSDMKYSSTETFHDHYPHICSVHLIPMYQMYGGDTPVWNKFTVWVNDEHRLACIPNMNFDYTCSGWNQNTSRCTAANTGATVLSNAVNWMDNQPISGQSIRYSLNATQTNTMNVGDSPCTLFTIFGMNGGNGTSSNIWSTCDINSNNNRYQVRTVRGFSHLDWAYVGSESNSSRQLFAWWKDQPEYPTPADPANPTPVEQAAILAWKATIMGDIHKMVAYTGAVFQDSVGGLNENPEERYIGLIDENGMATGVVEVITEETFEDFPQTASDNFIDDTPYDPSYVPGGDDSDPYMFPTNPRTGFAAFERVYALTRSDVDDLNDWLYDCTKYSLHPPDGTTDPEKLLEEYKNAAYGESPVNGIVSLMVFPTISIPLLLSSSGRDWIHVGTLLSNDIMGMQIEGMRTVKGYKINDETGIFVFNNHTMSIDWQPYYNDFRDYAPYTTAELVVPFHGSVQLDPADWCGHNIDVAFIVDFRTGASTALICRDGIPILSLDGNLGIQVPLHATDAANAINTAINNAFQVRSAELQKQTAIADAITSTIAGATSSAAGVRKVAANLDANAASMGAGLIAAGTPLVSAATKGIQGIRSADMNLSKAKQEMNHIPVTRMSVGSASTSVSAGAERYLRLNIHRPKMAQGYNPEIYGHTVGFACNMFGNVSDFHGYTECGDIDCSGIPGATEEEKNMIHDAMVSGTYL